MKRINTNLPLLKNPTNLLNGSTGGVLIATLFSFPVYADAIPIRNQVEVPEYITPVDPSAATVETSDEKIQFIPESKEQPLLIEKESPDQAENGAKYPPANEMYVAPEPQLVLSDEAIVEPPAEEKKEPPKAKKRRIIFRKKTSCECPKADPYQ